MELILSWQYSGFNVYVGKTISPDDKESLTHVARYMLRAPVILSRVSYDHQHCAVNIEPHNSYSQKPLVLDVLDLIARLSVQIPGPDERLLLYYGSYSNASRQRRVTIDREELPGRQAPQTLDSAVAIGRRRWRR